MRIAFIIAAVPLMFHAAAQGTQVRAELDTAVLRIGEQTRLHLVVSWSGDASGMNVAWPQLKDTINAQVEVLAMHPADTVLHHADGFPERHALRQAFTITSFDSGYWAIPPFRIAVNGDTLETQPLLLEVRSVPVDTAADARDIKEIDELPFSMMYWLRKHWHWVAGGMVALAAVLLLVRWMRNRERPAQEAPAPEPELPLVDRTLMALQRADQQQLWQQGLHKEYHSTVTDILRAYVEERFDVFAMERTTSELIQQLRLTSAGQEACGRLENMLRLADMVKFAKVTPAPVENEHMMAGAIRFVNETAPVRTDNPEHGKGS